MQVPSVRYEEMIAVVAVAWSVSQPAMMKIDRRRLSTMVLTMTSTTAAVTVVPVCWLTSMLAYCPSSLMRMVCFEVYRCCLPTQKRVQYYDYVVDWMCDPAVLMSLLS